MRRFIAKGAGVGGMLLPALAMGQLTGYELLSDWDGLPASKQHLTAGLASSYDRSGGNNDWNHYHSPAGHLNDPVLHDGIEVVLMEVTGPGVLTRFWMPHAGANAGMPHKVYVDGQLIIDTDSNVRLNGTYGYMGGPLTYTQVGGQTSYEPIVFGQSLRIESRNYPHTSPATYSWAKGHHYYQANYYTFDPGTQVIPYTGALTSQQQAQRTVATQMLTNPGVNPGSPGAAILPTGGQSIAPGQALTLANLGGSGTIRALNVKMDGANDAALDGLRLRVRYGDVPGEAVDVPVSDFFGAGHGRVAYRSLPLGTDSPDGFYSYWPMPFRQGMTVELYNAGATAIAIDSARIAYDAGPVAADAGYLHAQHRQADLVAGDLQHTILQVEGEGHYVGNLLYLQYNGVYRSILEGDETITIDGTTVLQGTGLEDAYNGGYYYNHVAVVTDDGDVSMPTSGTEALSGLLRMDFDTLGDPITRTDQYRWMIGDLIPFSESLDVRIENYGARASSWGSTAFYYLVVPEPSAGITLGLAALLLMPQRKRPR